MQTDSSVRLKIMGLLLRNIACEFFAINLLSLYGCHTEHRFPYSRFRPKILGDNILCKYTKYENDLYAGELTTNKIICGDNDIFTFIEILIRCKHIYHLF